MDQDWTASFSIRFRNDTCIIILDKKYNIANSSCHFGSYAVHGPVRHQKNSIWTSEASVHIIFFWWRTGPYTASFGPYNIFGDGLVHILPASVHIIFFWWRTGPYTAIWPSVPWTICYRIHHDQFVPYRNRLHYDQFVPYRNRLHYDQFVPSGGFRGGRGASGACAPLKFAKHMLYNVN